MFFTRFEELAKEKGKKTTTIGHELGIPASSMSYWRNNPSASPKPDVLAKLSEYFDVSVDYLVGKCDNRKPIIIDIDTDVIKAALFQGSDYVTDEMWNEVVTFARFIETREASKNKKDN